MMEDKMTKKVKPFDIENYAPEPIYKVREHDRKTEEYQRYVLEDIDNGNFVALSVDELFLWKLMDGKKTVSELAGEFMLKHGKLSVETLVSFIAVLWKAGFLKNDPGMNVVQDEIEVKSQEKIRLLHFASFPFGLFFALLLIPAFIFSPSIIEKNFSNFLLYKGTYGKGLFVLLTIYVLMEILVVIYKMVHTAYVTGRKAEFKFGLKFGFPVVQFELGAIQLLSKNKRVWVILSGVWFHLIVACFLFLVIKIGILNAEYTPFLFKIAGVCLLRVFFSLCPFLNNEFYTALKEFSSCNDLREKSVSFFPKYFIKLIRNKEPFMLIHFVYLGMVAIMILWMMSVFHLGFAFLDANEPLMDAMLFRTEGDNLAVLLGYLFFLPGVFIFLGALFGAANYLWYWLNGHGKWAKIENIVVYGSLFILSSLLIILPAFDLEDYLNANTRNNFLFFLAVLYLGMGLISSARIYGRAGSSSLHFRFLFIGIGIFMLLVSCHFLFFLSADSTYINSVLLFQSCAFVFFLASLLISLKKMYFFKNKFVSLLTMILGSIWLFFLFSIYKQYHDHSNLLFLVLFLVIQIPVGFVLILQALKSFYQRKSKMTLPSFCIFVGYLFVAITQLILMEYLFRENNVDSIIVIKALWTLYAPWSFLIGVGFLGLGFFCQDWLLKNYPIIPNTYPVQVIVNDDQNILNEGVNYFLQSIESIIENFIGKNVAVGLKNEFNFQSFKKNISIANKKTKTIIHLADNAHAGILGVFDKIKDIVGNDFSVRMIKVIQENMHWEPQKILTDYVFHDDEWLKKIVVKQDFGIEKRLEILSNVFLFNDLNSGEMRILASCTRIRNYGKGELIIREGEVGQAFYINIQGALQVEEIGDTGLAEAVSYMREGDFFGEIALLEDVPRTASVRANTTAKLLEIRKYDFKNFLQLHEDVEVKLIDILENLRLFKHIPLFRELPAGQIDILLSRLRPTTALKGEVIVKQGEKGDCFYIIKTGRVTASFVDASGRIHELAKLAKGEYFGEISLLRPIPRTASVIADEDLELLVLSKADFLDICSKCTLIQGGLVQVTNRRIKNYYESKRMLRGH